jgi:hypothetical protein
MSENYGNMPERRIRQADWEAEQEVEILQPNIGPMSARLNPADSWVDNGHKWLADQARKRKDYIPTTATEIPKELPLHANES